jgi:signal peptidase I
LRLRIFRVQGNSLHPEYHSGDFLLISRIPIQLNLAHTGSLVVFKQPGYGVLVKRIERISADRQNFWVCGSSPGSVDSRVFGEVSKKDLLGVVICSIKKQSDKRQHH